MSNWNIPNLILELVGNNVCVQLATYPDKPGVYWYIFGFANTGHITLHQSTPTSAKKFDVTFGALEWNTVSSLDDLIALNLEQARRELLEKNEGKEPTESQITEAITREWQSLALKELEVTEELLQLEEVEDDWHLPSRMSACTTERVVDGNKTIVTLPNKRKYKLIDTGKEWKAVGENNDQHEGGIKVLSQYESEDGKKKWAYVDNFRDDETVEKFLKTMNRQPVLFK